MRLGVEDDDHHISFFIGHGLTVLPSLRNRWASIGLREMSLNLSDLAKEGARLTLCSASGVTRAPVTFERKTY